MLRSSARSIICVYVESMSSVLMTLDTKPKSSYNIHPEMKDVEDGDELIVFTPYIEEEND